MRTGACLAGSGPHGGTGTRATGRPRGKLAGGTCVVGAKPRAGRYFVARVLELSSLRQANMGPVTKTPALSAAQRQHQQQQQQHDDTTRYDTTRSRSRNRTASRDRHVPTPSSSPAISSQQWYLASHCLVCGMTKVSFVVRTQAARRVLSQIRRPRRPVYGPSYQGMATSVKVVALDLSLALAPPNRAVQDEAKGLDLVPSIRVPPPSTTHPVFWLYHIHTACLVSPPLHKPAAQPSDRHGINIAVREPSWPVPPTTEEVLGRPVGLVLSMDPSRLGCWTRPGHGAIRFAARYQA
ncbi:hypothetical protein HDV63DRAFT_295438 [Trichoderma sp. SZMC 28014]